MLPTIVKASHGSGQVVRLKCWTAVPGSGPIGKREFFDQLAVCEASGRLVLRLLYVFCVCFLVGLCIPSYHVRNNYITYIVAM